MALSSRVYRLDPKTKAKQYACRNALGSFVLGDPNKGNQKHHSKNQIFEMNEDKMIALVKAGYSIRVQTSQSPSLVNLNIYVDGTRIR